LDAGESATKKSPDRKPYKQTETESRVAREVSPGARAPPSNEGFDGELGNPRGRREQYLRRRRADEGEERGGGARVGSPLGFEREIVPSSSTLLLLGRLGFTSNRDGLDISTFATTGGLTRGI